MKKQSKWLFLLVPVVIVIAVVVGIFTKPLAVEEQRAFFEQADEKSDNIALTVRQVGDKRFFDCLDVCNYVSVKFKTEPLSVDELNQEIDQLLSEKYERKYDLIGRVFYNPEVERNCTLIKNIQEKEHFDTCTDVQPFWQVKGGIAYQPVGEALPGCDVITVELDAKEFTNSDMNPQNSEYTGAINCEKNASIDTYSDESFLEPLSCGNFKVCYNEGTQVRSY